MAHQRGNIVEVAFDLPYDGASPTHPFIIISNDDVYEQDGRYICVMITHMKHTDKYTFEITDDMLVKGGDGKFCQARCHLITSITDDDIIVNSNRNSLKTKAVDRLVEYITNTSLL